jgi:EAL domain-containing protein (putative c-di-GMP-specific phosphodiesterase class I)
VTALTAIRDLGVGIALDDFGTGQSSLSLLQSCPIDILKVDKSFVDEISAHGPRPVIAAALITVSAEMQLTAVAEGVETLEQAEQLFQLGYRYAQGFYFAYPMNPADLERTLNAPRATASLAAV